MAERSLHILHLTPNYLPVPGGIERFVADLCARSQAAGDSASVLCFNRPDRQHPLLPADEVIQNIPVRRVPFWDLKYYKPALLPVNRLRAADVLHVHGIGAMLDFAVLTKHLHGRPIVLSTHGGIFHTPRFAIAKRVYFNSVAGRMLDHVERVMACSRTDFELFRPIAPQEELLENGVNFDALVIEPTPPRDPQTFLFVGRLAANKHVDRLIRTFAIYRRNLPTGSPPAQLRIIGEDWQNLAGGLAGLATSLNLTFAATPDADVRYFGAVSQRELAVAYHRTAFFVSASMHEGFGISAVEAMACGCVPVLSDIPAFRRFVGDGTGVLTDYSDAPSAAAQWMRAAGAMDARGHRNAARTRALEFSWETVFPRWIKVYRELARRG